MGMTMGGTEDTGGQRGGRLGGWLGEDEDFANAAEIT